MARANITLGQFIEAEIQNPPYIQLFTGIEEGNSAIVMVQDHIVSTCSTSRCKFYGDVYGDRLSDFCRIVRISKEDLSKINLKVMTMTLKFKDGLIEKHTFNVPRSSRLQEVKSSVEIDDTNVVELLESSGSPEMEDVVNTTSSSELPHFVNVNYYTTIQRVEKRNGAFPCILGYM